MLTKALAQKQSGKGKFLLYHVRDPVSQKVVTEKYIGESGRIQYETE